MLSPALLTGCTAENPPAASTAVVLVASEPAGLNELVSGGGRATQDVIDRLFLHLFEEQPDFRTGPPTFQGQLAESWHWSDDTTLDLHLRRDVRWSDGVPVTADDVEFTWRAQTDPAVGWRYSELKGTIAALEVIDPHRLRVRFDRRAPDSLANLNQGVILPRHAWGELPFERWPAEAGWFEEHLVTSGPFRLGAWEPQQHLLLERNPDYYEPGLPRVDRLLLRVVPLRQNRIRAVADGDADFVEALTYAEAATLAGNPRVVVERGWHRQYDYIAWNLRRPAFADAATRKALTQALDREELVQVLWGGDARIAVSPILTSVWAYDRSLAPWPHDVEAARALLREAGWQLEGDGWRRAGLPLRLDLLVNTANPLHVDAARLAARQWSQLGVDVEVKRAEFRAMIAELDAGTFDAAIGSWGIDTSLDLGYAFHSKAIADGYNSGGYSNPEVDARIDRLRLTTALDERRRLLIELQRQIHADQPYTFLWEPPRYDVRSVRLRSAKPNALSGLFRAREWSIGDRWLR